MSANNSIFKNRTGIIAVSFLLVMVLAACVFGMEYSSAVNDAESKIASQNSRIEAIEAQKDKLASQNTKNKAQITSQQQQINDLNSEIKKLESEIAHIKLTKAEITKAESSSSKETALATSTPAPVSSKKTETDAPKKINLKLLTKPNEGSKVCYLTFDDGPSNNTLKILDILEKANAKASFFVVATSKFDYVKNIYAAGHTVALHSNGHDYSKIYKSEDAYFKDLNTLSKKVKKLIGFEPKIIRFPGGSSNAVSKKYNEGIMTRLTKKVEKKGYVYVDWNVDSTDASGNNVAKSKILSSIKSETKGKGDICILMHDTDAKNTTVDALPEIICYLRACGYRFEALTTQSAIFHHGINN